MIRYRLFTIFFFFSFASMASEVSERFTEKAHDFFSQHVVGVGVDYAGIKSEPQELEVLVKMIGEMKLESLSKVERKAFLINAYNILVIEQVVTNFPAISSPMDVSGFFDRTEILVGDKSMTLDKLEKSWLLKEFKDPRLHFVLVCAARGCPPIASFAYSPDRLEEQIEVQTTKALNALAFIRVNQVTKEVMLPEIFKWYENDFSMTNTSVVTFINKYRFEKLNLDYTYDYYSYDWSLNQVMVRQKEEVNVSELPTPVQNLQSFTPSSTIGKGQVELKLFNNLYTQTDFFDQERALIAGSSRSTYYTGLTSFFFGLNDRVNIGFEFTGRGVRLENTEYSPLRVFFAENNMNSRFGISKIGPKVKWQPFRSLARLSVQSAVYLPIMRDLEGKTGDHPWLDWDSYVWSNQIYFDKTLGSKFQVFSAMELYMHIPRDSYNNFVQFITPIKAIVNYFPSSKLTFYTLLEFGPQWGQTELFSAYYTQLGVGAKYQVLPSLEFETSATTFPVGKNQGAGRTLNLGVRFLK